MKSNTQKFLEQKGLYKYIKFLLSDDRNCRSDNMKKFFKNPDNQINCNVIRFEGKLWFASLGWDNDGKGFAGVRVMEVACQGNKAKTGYPSWQHPDKWHDVTEWFWGKYMERGIISIPEIWNRVIPRELSFAELHTI